MSSAPNVVPGTGLAVTVASGGGVETSRVYYQGIHGGIFESVSDGKTWSGGIGGSSIFEAAPHTPLAAVNWDNGEEVRVYYLDQKYTVQEFCYSEKSGKWAQGTDLSSFVKVAPKSSLAAFCYIDNSGPHIQAESLNIQEIAHDEGQGWKKGATLATALDGTSIAATVYNFQKLAFRVYYQVDDLTLREQIRDEGATRWSTGAFRSEPAPAGTPITALGVDKTVPHLRVFWMNVQREVVHARTPSVGSWVYDDQAIVSLPYYAKIAVSQVHDGASIRLYYQLGDTSVLELRGDGTVWGETATVAKA